MRLGRKGGGLNPGAPCHSSPHEGVWKEPWASKEGRYHSTCPHCWDVAGKWTRRGGGKVGRRRHDNMGVDYWIREAPGWRTGQGD